MSLLAHLFFPRHTNNFRAKILQPSGLFLISLVFIFFYVARLPHHVSQILGYTAARLSVDELVADTNRRRLEAGLSPLKFNQTLSEAAKAKGSHMFAQNYWAHVAPDGTTPWSFFLTSGYDYKFAGENLARDFESPGDVVRAWMASPTHRDNMLSGKYEDIGIAVVEGELNGEPTTIVVQLLGSKINNNLAKLPAIPPAPLKTEEIPTLSYPGTLSLTQGSQTAFNVKKNMAVILAVLLLAILTLDGLVIWHQKIVRISGRNMAHFSFLISILLILLGAKGGQVL